MSRDLLGKCSDCNAEFGPDSVGFITHLFAEHVCAPTDQPEPAAKKKPKGKDK